MLQGFIKGDTIELEITANIDITGWKLRYEIYDDDCNSIQGATSNSGGSDAQIEVTDETNGVFLLKVAKNETTDFDDNSFIEIEREDVDGKILTIFQDEFKFNSEKITWTTPTN